MKNYKKTNKTKQNFTSECQDTLFSTSWYYIYRQKSKDYIPRKHAEGKFMIPARNLISKNATTDSEVFGKIDVCYRSGKTFWN